MHYTTGHALNTKELLLNFPTNKLNMTAKECEELIGNRHKEYITNKVFKACVKLVIDDIIDNNATFKLPTRARNSELCMKRYDRDEFIKCRQNGKFQDVQFLNSNFTGYLMCFNYQQSGVMRLKLIYLDSKNKLKIIDNTNKGKSYC